MAGEMHTAGPWSWFGNAKNHEIYLATEHSGRRYVMGFERWGMRGAQPRFQPTGRGLVPASDLLTFEVGDRSVRGVEAAKTDDSVYRLDISGIDCADARLIAAAPTLLEALKNLHERIVDAWPELANLPPMAAARAAILLATPASLSAEGER